MFTLYPHQQEALQKLRENDSYGLWLEQGLGKTLTILSRLAELFEEGKIQNAIIIAPISAMQAWYRDIEKLDECQRDLLIAGLTIINYQKVWRGGSKSPYNKVYDCVVVDEAQRIRNRKSKQTDFILHLSLNAKYRYLLSGTPIANGKLEGWWSLICFFDPYIHRGYMYSRILGSYYQFLDKYAVLNQYHQPYRWFHVDEIQKTVDKYSIRMKKEDCLNLPDKLPDDIIYCDCNYKQMYSKLANKSALLEYNLLCANPLALSLRLRQMCSGFLTNEYGDLIWEKDIPKDAMLSDILEGLEGKLVIFADFKHSVNKIASIVAKHNLSYVTLNGEQKDKGIWRKFQSDDSIQVIICNYTTASEGIDLFASNQIVFYEPTIKSIELEQSRDRIHRNGQTKACSYKHLITKGTIEEVIYKTLARYEDFNEKFFTEYIEKWRKV